MFLIMKVNLCVDGGVMEKYKSNQWLHHSPFSLWNIRPWVCVIDGKRHIRTFLRDALEEFDFITSECASDVELSGTLKTQHPDIVVLGPSADQEEDCQMLTTLAASDFAGKVLILGPQTTTLEAIQLFGHALGLAMLPAVPTPFSSERLRNSIMALLS
jgi:DNA-binding NtrC family response regulator